MADELIKLKRLLQEKLIIKEGFEKYKFISISFNAAFFIRKRILPSLDLASKALKVLQNKS
ncbi:hypothetical protein KQI67_22395 [Bacillus albus]|uniref:hypothetical protein n=1 Tax=Bacillus albus TaxID=2026189 RepID=UPI001C10B0E5|nr:hypothetical protein [Bacillus albus]MBU5219423.1 hypothetical protein [Bacillus albus]